jgi:hypothetical protein
MTNPILKNETAICVDLESLEIPVIHARKRKTTAKREKLLLWRQQNAEQAIDLLTQDVEVYGLTKGQFSLLDLLKAALKKTGAAKMDFSTWTANRSEALQLAEMKNRGELLSVRWLVDMTFVRRDPEAAAAIRADFGAESIRVAQCHAKFALFYNKNWKLVLRTSMNLNMNPRTEDFHLAHDPELFDFIHGVMNKVFTMQPKGMANQKPGVIAQYFKKEMI